MNIKNLKHKKAKYDVCYSLTIALGLAFVFVFEKLFEKNIYLFIVWIIGCGIFLLLGLFFTIKCIKLEKEIKKYDLTLEEKTNNDNSMNV